ncbi:tRNA 5-methylaminomethyl-2-thiouridine biosynthesis bifunctional protein MnmC [Capnocytophaga ochracea]|uniref:tRNA 5-methylaminomethyl-2-thiouridine biosynthesis bifunctional protein MnmC n=1 Tax=Capnocytophaga ochracea TaxID=1018 RepID=A0A2X2R8B4_CAPOC|nr:tRNA (5-methylaminomethyl-2-thiouridine)(34)-methyltransferase MnmD [Capnocytophaga ochracea]SQA77328.1 tRNA 5-methylaminomethyl-2-thiouridine biosynthesis bifunctional protein MnmC [Capnocytophaga ochracea]
MTHKLIRTSDGSTSLYIPQLDETYHSVHGALQETQHVFIKNGLQLFDHQSISILEIGFGTGLNALATYKEHEFLQLNIHYETVEAYPLSYDEASQMNFPQMLNAPALVPVFEQMHRYEWNKLITLSPSFSFKKRLQRFETINDTDTFDLIYFDAFGAQVQPELWQEAIFQRMYTALKQGGYLVTYAAKGSVRRAMQACGFTVERLPGPLMKREMLRAHKD